jgi:hypothetical protein
MTDQSGAGANPAVTVKEAKHMKIPLFYGRADGRDEVKAEDLIDRIEANCLDFLSRGSCQNPEVRSMVEKMQDSALPISPIHLLMSFME